MKTEESKAAARYVRNQNSQVKLRHRISRLETLLGRVFLILHNTPGASELVQDIEHEIINHSCRLQYLKRRRDML